METSAEGMEGKYVHNLEFVLPLFRRGQGCLFSLNFCMKGLVSRMWNAPDREGVRSSPLNNKNIPCFPRGEASRFSLHRDLLNVGNHQYVGILRLGGVKGSSESKCCLPQLFHSLGSTRGQSQGLPAVEEAFCKNTELQRKRNFLHFSYVFAARKQDKVAPCTLFPKVISIVVILLERKHGNLLEGSEKLGLVIIYQMQGRLQWAKQRSIFPSILSPQENGVGYRGRTQEMHNRVNCPWT